jgi:hypothetical protein
MSIILKGLFNALCKSWIFSLIVFFIAALDVNTWFYTVDSCTVDPIITLIICLLYSTEFLLPRQQFQWAFWRFCVKKSHEVYLCIVISFTLSAFRFSYAYSIIIAINSIFSHFIKSLLKSNNQFGRVEKLIKFLRHIIPTILVVAVVALFRNILETLVTSKSSIEILYFAAYNIFLLLKISLVLYLGAVLNILMNNFPYHDCLLAPWRLLGKSWRLSLRVFSPICLNCGHILSDLFWCQNCGKKYFTDNLSKWTSGNETIDKLIEDIQLNAKNEVECIEWIPYSEF